MSWNYSSNGWSNTSPFPPAPQRNVAEFQTVQPTVLSKTLLTDTGIGTGAPTPQTGVTLNSGPGRALRPASPKPFWSPAEQEKLVSLRDQGLTYPEIAMQLPGRTARACEYSHNKLLSRKSPVSGQVKEEAQAGREIKREVEHGDSGLLDTACKELQKATQRLEMASMELKSTPSMKPDHDFSRGDGVQIVQPPVVVPAPQLGPWSGGEDLILLEMLSRGFSFADLERRLPGRPMEECHRRYRFWYDQWEDLR